MFRSILVSLVIMSSISATSCPTGSRLIIVKPLTVASNVYSGKTDSTSRVMKYHKLYSSLLEKISTKTPCYSYFGKYDSLLFDTTHTVNLSQLATFSDPGSIPDQTDYIFGGSIVLNGADVQCDISVTTPDGIEIAPLPPVTLTDGFDPDAVSDQMAKQTNVLLTGLEMQEREKRNSGAPYAFAPAITLTASKRVLDFGETSVIHVALTDNDGAQLPNRTITLSVNEGGTLAPLTTITDNGGFSDVTFTAGTTPSIAVISAKMSYTTPSGRKLVCNAIPCAIQIRKPEDCWYIHAEYSESSNRSDNSISIIESVYYSSGIKMTTVDSKLYVDGWFKNIGSSGRFVAGEAVKIAFSGYHDERVIGLTSTKSVTGASTETYNLVHRETAKAAGLPTYVYKTGPDQVDFSIRNIPSVILGQELTVLSGYDKTKTPRDISETSSKDLSNESMMAADAQGFARDTSYNEVNETSAGSGQKTHEVTNVKQTFSFDGKIGLFDRTYSFTQDETVTIGGVSQNSHLTQTLTASVTLEYNSQSGVVDKVNSAKIPGIANVQFNRGTLIVKCQSQDITSIGVELFDAAGRVLLSKIVPLTSSRISLSDKSIDGNRIAFCRLKTLTAKGSVKAHQVIPVVVNSR